MKILALERELQGISADGFKLHLRTEAIKIWELYRQSVIRELYFNPETHTAVLVLECQDLDEAKQTLSQLPLVQAGLIRFELIPSSGCLE